MVAINYLWNPINDNIVREFDDAGTTIAEYTTEPDLYGNVVSQVRDGQTSCLVSDGQGNTTELTNDAGDVTDRIRYTAFGEVTQRTGTTELPFQYGGQKGYYRDQGTGENSVRQRPLNSSLGRWLSRDPLTLSTDPENVVALPWQLAAYVYARSSPFRFADPSGLFDCDSISTERLQYSCNCGWIDWNHAQKDGDFSALWQTLLTDAGQVSLMGGGSKYCYQRSHGIDWPFRFRVGPGGQCYYVKHDLSQAQKESVALALYQEVQNDFERWQGSSFFGRWKSSFSCEDLSSDLIQFYLSIEKVSEDQVKLLCGIVNDISTNARLCEATKCMGCPRITVWPPAAGSPFYIDYWVAAAAPCHLEACDYPCFFALNRWPPELDTIPPAKKGALWRDWTLGHATPYTPIPNPPQYDEYEQHYGGI